MLPEPKPGYIDTYYTRTVDDLESAYAPLRADVDCDVCVIGGGLAGINAAFGLMLRGQSVVLMDANRIGWGASGRNGGFVARGYAADHTEIAKRVGLAHARALVDLTRDARQLIRDRMTEFSIDAGPLKPGVLTVSWKDDPGDIQKYVAAANHDFDAGLEYWPTERVREHCKTDKYFQGFYSPHDYQFHSLRYLHGLARVMAGRGVRIHEQTPALQCERVAQGWRVRTPGGVVTARHIVMSCAMDSHGLNKRIERSAFPVRTYVMVTTPLSDDDLQQSINTPHAMYDTRFTSDYYRVLPDNRVMWGGRVALWAKPDDIAGLLLRDMLKVYPQLTGKVRAELAWSGTMCYAPHKMPQLGELEPGFWYCTAFGGHGLVPTTVGGEAIADAICGNRKTLDLFAPFGLSYAGGKLGRYAAQMVYWWWRLRDIINLKSTMSGA